VDAFVAGESPGSLDAMFGGLAGAGGQTLTQLSAKLARGIRRAGATSSARVLTWLFLNPTHT